MIEPSPQHSRSRRTLRLVLVLLPLLALVVGWTHQERIVDLIVRQARFYDSASTTLKGVWVGSATVDGATTATLALVGVRATDVAFGTLVSGAPDSEDVLVLVGLTLDEDEVLVELNDTPDDEAVVNVVVIRK